MTNDKGRDIIEEAIAELAAYSEKADNDGLIVKVPIKPFPYPYTIQYKRVEPGLWFEWAPGTKRWGPKLDDAYEYVFQAGIKEGMEREKMKKYGGGTA